MKIVKESITKIYDIKNQNCCLIEEIKRYRYDTEVEKIQHSKEMQLLGFSDSGQVKEDIGSVMKPEYVWFGSYYKHITQ